MQTYLSADIPQKKQELFKKRLQHITKNTDHLFLFAADQKMAHLNKDFFGPDLASEINNPEHVFTIAQESPVGAFATHVGLIARYGLQFSNIPYIAKLDGKTNLSSQEPYSKQMWSVQDALELNVKNLCGVGYTVYLGSEYERNMLTEAAQIVHDAHQNGLVAILWIYPRGKEVPDEHTPEIIAGAAGMGATLGADFVKIQQPTGPASNLRQAVGAAGNTKVIVSGGEKQNPESFLKEVHANIQEGGVAGGAIGRNIFQHPKKQAIALATALSFIIYENGTFKEGLDLYKSLY